MIILRKTMNFFAHCHSQKSWTDEILPRRYSAFFLGGLRNFETFYGHITFNLGLLGRILITFEIRYPLILWIEATLSSGSIDVTTEKARVVLPPFAHFCAWARAFHSARINHFRTKKKQKQKQKPPVTFAIFFLIFFFLIRNSPRCWNIVVDVILSLAFQCSS